LATIYLVAITSLSAQEWHQQVIKGDELKGMSDYISFAFYDGSKGFVFWNNEENTFRLSIDKSDGFFNYSDLRGNQGHHIIYGLVGFYDSHDKLLDKIDPFIMELDDEGTPNKLHPNRYTKMGGNNNKNTRKILSYIKNEEGYVRFVYKLYGGKEFDFKVKCMKSAK